MGHDHSNSNIIRLHLGGDQDVTSGIVDNNVENVSEFIVDMLDSLMKIAAKKDHSLLVYFLAMARIEASEMQKTENDKPE